MNLYELDDFIASLDPTSELDKPVIAHYQNRRAELCWRLSSVIDEKLKTFPNA